MKLLDERSDNFSKILDELIIRQSPDREHSVVKAVEQIIEEIREDGDKALFEFCWKFDKTELNASNVEVSTGEIDAAMTQVPQDMLDTLTRAHERIVSFHRHQIDFAKFDSFEYLDVNGMRLGMRIEPLEKIGIYVPGGKAAYPSTVLMAAVPAKLAGVSEIIMVSPQRGDTFHPYLLAAARIAGVNRIFRVGGAQAIAALAYGTKTIPRVNKIVGPGNAYVACAKRMLYGEVGIDMIAGPSEVLVISDGSANPAFIAADLLSQAEHDETARPIFITTSEWEARAVIEEVNCQLEVLPRSAIAKESVENNGFAILVENLDRAAQIANLIAPEHLELVCKNARKLADKIKYAGAIFIGRMTPEPIGDYVAGPNHILPTAGSARFRGPLGVYDFFRTTSIIEATKRAFLALADDVVRLADAEELPGHAQSVLIRLAKEKNKNEK